MPEAQVVRMRDVPAVDTTLPVAWLDVGGRREVAVPVARLSEVLDFPRRKELSRRNLETLPTTTLAELVRLSLRALAGGEI